MFCFFSDYQDQTKHCVKKSGQNLEGLVWSWSIIFLISNYFNFFILFNMPLYFPSLNEKKRNYFVRAVRKCMVSCNTLRYFPHGNFLMSFCSSLITSTDAISVCLNVSYPDEPSSLLLTQSWQKLKFNWSIQCDLNFLTALQRERHSIFPESSKVWVRAHHKMSCKGSLSKVSQLPNFPLKIDASVLSSIWLEECQGWEIVFKHKFKLSSFCLLLWWVFD